MLAAWPHKTGAESKMMAASRILKKASARIGRPPISVLAYFNSVLDWTAYDFHTWTMANKSRILHDVHGNMVMGRDDHFKHPLYIPDLSQAIVRDAWLENVLNTTRDMDGVFVDQGEWCSQFVCNKPPGMITPSAIDAYAHGHWDMLTRLRRAMPDKIILLNNLNLTDFPPPFDHECVLRGPTATLHSCEHLLVSDSLC
jgi:hypothetical protein